MLRQVYNPYLSSFEYIPDGGPGVRGTASGTILVLTDLGEDPIARISVWPTEGFSLFKVLLTIKAGVYPLFFQYEGKGVFDFEKFEIENW